MSAENITITERICRVKAEVTAVPKNGFNAHGQYSHATTDDVYHVLRPLLARHGLDFRVSIVRREMVGYGDGKFRLDYEFSLRFEAVDGQVEDESDTRYLSLPYTGPQTDETAMSYASKQYLRQRFQIETGDFESENALDDSGDPAAKHQQSTAALLKTPTGRRIRERLDKIMTDLLPSEVAAVNAAIKTASGIGELNTVAINAESTAAAHRRARNGAPARSNNQAPARAAPVEARPSTRATPPAAPAPARPSSSPAPAPDAKRRPRRPTPPDPAFDGVWYYGAPLLLGEDAEGNDDWGALLAPDTVPPVMAPVKIQVGRTGQRRRAVVTEILRMAPDGVEVAARPMTPDEEKAIEAAAAARLTAQGELGV